MHFFKKNCYKLLSTFGFLLAFPFFLFSQKQTDAGLWCTFTIEKNFTKKMTVGVDQELRLRENYSRLNLFYTNPYITYKLKKGFKVGLGYRFISKYMYQTTSFSFRHRLMFDLSYKHKFKNLILSYRSRIQGEIRDYNSSSQGKNPEYFWRNKLDVGYEIGKFTPYVGTELRYQIVDPRNAEGNYGWHRARSYVGIDYELNKTHSFGIMYLIQQEFDIDDPGTGYIIGLEYKISL